MRRDPCPRRELAGNPKEPKRLRTKAGEDGGIAARQDFLPACFRIARKPLRYAAPRA
jgi:hypothetical protein